MTTRDCKYGKLARSCNICELETENARLTEILQRTENISGAEEVRRSLDIQDKYKAEIDKIETQNGELRAENFKLKAHIKRWAESSAPLRFDSYRCFIRESGKPYPTQVAKGLEDDQT